MNTRRIFCPWLFVGCALLFAAPASAQLVQWTTNYYSVTGANFREIRQSIAAARPWKDPFDGDTRWTINWKFSTRETGAGCVCASYSTTTKITTTLPRWKMPANATGEARDQWFRYFTSLEQHETGHARLGLAASAEVRKRLSEIGVQPDCDRLRKLINERAEKAVDDYRAREREYDRRTEHGMKPAGGP